MVKELIIRKMGSLIKYFATFSFGFIKGMIYEKNKLKKDNQHIIDMLNDK